MATNIPDNPYPEEKETTVYAIGRGISLFVIVVFFLLVLIPVVLDHVNRRSLEAGEGAPDRRAFWYEVFSPPSFDPNQPDPAKKSLVSHLRWLERGLEKAPYVVGMRQKTQRWLMANFAEGTQKVFIGYEGWLFYQPDLKALTGYGPLKPEPFSVMKDPHLAKLPAAEDCIVKFAAQLQERGVRLLLVPVPLKPMIYSEQMIGGERPPTREGGKPQMLTHPDAGAFYERLRRHGVDVLDLTEAMARIRDERKSNFYHESTANNRAEAQASEEALKVRKDAFLKQDTHWTHDAMLAMSLRIAAHVKEKYPEAFRVKQLNPDSTSTFNAFQTPRLAGDFVGESMGDLVKLLDLRNPAEFFAPEKFDFGVLSEGSERRDAPIVLLGDSFVNIFDDPSLGFENPKAPGKPMRSGIAQWLSKDLDQPLDVIAQNGRGSTGVRRDFARRYDDEVRAKKLVIWVIAARDVLLSRTAAHQANIEWDYVTFNPKKGPDAADAPPNSPPKSGAIVVEATLRQKSANQDLGGPYRDALHAALYEVNRVVEGELKPTSVVGIQWTFKDKVMQPTSTFTVGKKYKLTLTPWETRKELQGTNLQDDTDDFEASRYFVESAEEVR